MMGFVCANILLLHRRMRSGTGEAGRNGHDKFNTISPPPITVTLWQARGLGNWSLSTYGPDNFVN